MLVRIGYSIGLAAQLRIGRGLEADDEGDLEEEEELGRLIKHIAVYLV